MKHAWMMTLGIVLCLSLASVADAAKAKAPATADSTAARRAPGPAPKGAVRTLDAIRIEGEIDVPQVLFITARETRRFRDGTGPRYRATSAGVAGSIPMPSRLRVVAPYE
jgi:hypothetical protein